MQAVDKKPMKQQVLSDGGYSWYTGVSPTSGQQAIASPGFITVKDQNILNMKEEGEPSPWPLSSIVTEYKDMFQGDGHLESKLKLEIDLYIQLMRLRKHRIPSGLVVPLKKELAS